MRYASKEHEEYCAREGAFPLVPYVEAEGAVVIYHRKFLFGDAVPGPSPRKMTIGPKIAKTKFGFSFNSYWQSWMRDAVGGPWHLMSEDIVDGEWVRAMNGYLESISYRDAYSLRQLIDDSSCLNPTVGGAAAHRRFHERLESELRAELTGKGRPVPDEKDKHRLFCSLDRGRGYVHPLATTLWNLIRTGEVTVEDAPSKQEWAVKTREFFVSKPYRDLFEFMNDRGNDHDNASAKNVLHFLLRTLTPECLFSVVMPRYVRDVTTLLMSSPPLRAPMTVFFAPGKDGDLSGLSPEPGVADEEGRGENETAIVAYLDVRELTTGSKRPAGEKDRRKLRVLRLPAGFRCIPLFVLSHGMRVDARGKSANPASAVLLQPRFAFELKNVRPAGVYDPHKDLGDRAICPADVPVIPWFDVSDVRIRV